MPLTVLTETMPASGGARKSTGQSVVYLNEQETARKLNTSVGNLRGLVEAGRLATPTVAKSSKQRYWLESAVDAARLQEAERALKRDGVAPKPPADAALHQDWFERQLLAD